MAGIDNLDPVRTTEEAKKRGSAGGKKAAENKRRRKQARECMEMILSSKVTGDKAKKVLANMGIEKEDQQNIMLLMTALFQKGASTGDAATIRSILEISGDLNTQQETQAPTININVSAADPSDIENE